MRRYFLYRSCKLSIISVYFLITGGIFRVMSYKSLSSATESVEQAFRNVDRGDYISGFPNTQVYGPDQTLRKTDNTYAHLSAPCIYAAVVEALDIRLGTSVCFSLGLNFNFTDHVWFV